MQKYQEWLIDDAGNKRTNVTIEVRVANSTPGAGVKATIASNEAGAAKANPFTNLADGSYSFFAADGRYDVVLNPGTVDQKIIAAVEVVDGLELSRRSVRAASGETPVTIPPLAERTGNADRVMVFDKDTGAAKAVPIGSFPPGPIGPPGTNNTVGTLEELAALDTDLVSAIAAGATFIWKTGDYSALVDGVDYVASDDIAATVGAWVRIGQEDLRKLGAFSGATIADNQTPKQAMQALEMAVETKATAEALGVTATAVNLGAFTSPLIDDNVTAKAALESIGTNLAASTAAANLGSIASVTGATARPIASRIGEPISLRDTGAIGLNNAGDAAAIDTLLSNVTPGQAIRAFRTDAAAAAFKRTDSSFALSRGVDLEFESGVDLRVDQTAGERDDVLAVNVTLTNGETTPSTSGEWRGGWIKGGRLFTNALSGSQTASGGYGVSVGSGSSKSIIGLTFEKQNISGGLGAVNVSSAFNRTGSGSEIAWTQFVRCTLTGTTTFAAEDGLIAADCIAIGQVSGAAAYLWDMTPGAFCSGVYRGTIAGVGGAAQINNGTMVKLHNVQIEHGGDASTGLAGGAQIVVSGLDYKAQAVEVIGCNIGAGAFVTNSINLFNATNTIIDRCQINIAGGGASADLLLNRDATTAAKDTDNTIVGYMNSFRGARSVQGFGTFTDVTRRMIISQSGGALRKQHRGIWFPLFALLTSTASDLTDASSEVMVKHCGALGTNPIKFTRATFFPSGLNVATFPLWLMPRASQMIPVYGDGGEFGTAFLNAATGVLTMNSNTLAASTSLTIPNHAWNVVVNPDYVAEI